MDEQVARTRISESPLGKLTKNVLPKATAVRAEPNDLKGLEISSIIIEEAQECH